MRCWSATGRLPINGSDVAGCAAPPSASCSRVSVKSAVSEGVASEMIDEVGPRLSLGRIGCDSRADVSRSTSGKSVGDRAAPPPAWA